MKSRSVIRLQGFDRLAFGLLWGMAFNTLVTFRFLENRHLNLPNLNRVRSRLESQGFPTSTDH